MMSGLHFPPVWNQVLAGLGRTSCPVLPAANAKNRKASPRSGTRRAVEPVPRGMKKLRTASQACMLLLGAAAAFAQSPSTPPDPATMAKMRVNALASQLNLTDAQKTTAIGIFTTAYTNAQSIQTSLQTNRTS